jgi:NAD(P)-dependent dehydrogenase (short-subunit alcohol dehydrogenase family)
LITGGARRIGAAVAGALVRQGYAVVLHANRSRGEAEILAGEIVDGGQHLAWRTADSDLAE